MASMADSQALSDAVAFTRNPGETMSGYLSRAQFINRKFLPHNIRSHFGRRLFEGIPEGEVDVVLSIVAPLVAEADDQEAFFG
jgi:hypothetical protein